MSDIHATVAGVSDTTRPERANTNPSRPRALFVAPVAVEGGVTEVLAGLVRRAEDGGYDPYIVFLRDGPAVERFRGFAPAVLRAGRLRRPHSFARTVIELDAIIRRTRPDAVVSMEPSAHLYAAGPAWLRRVPATLMHHGLPDAESRVDRLAGRLPATATIANSQFTRDRLRPLANAPLHVLQPGIDVDAMAQGDGREVRDRFGIPADAPLVGMIGRLQEWKGQQIFLEAARLVSFEHSDAHFVIVGSANMGWEDLEYPHTLKTLADSLGIADRVTFTGHSGEIPDWMAAIDVSVHASENEPYGLVICESLAAGCALVSVTQGGPLELVDNERTGLLTTRDAPSLAACVTRLLADAPLRRRLGAAGQLVAREKMSDVRMARGLGQILATTTRLALRSPLPRPLRVLFVAPVSVQGGANEVLLALADPSKHGSYDSLVVALRPGPLIDRLLAGDIRHVLLNAPRMRSLLHTTRTLRHLDRIIARWQPDLVFSTEAAGHVYAALPAARRRVPALWRQPARPNARDPIGFLANRLPARAVAVASRFVAAEQEEIGSRPVAIMPPGIELRRLEGADGPRLRREQGIRPDELLVTIVGRLQQWKGQDLFLQAAAQVATAHPSARFAIVGGAEMGWETGDFPGMLRELVSTLGLSDRVCFSGQTDHVSDWYAASDIVVHASDHEPFGLVVCEAMLMGCAVIASDEGGPREIVQHGMTGLLAARNAQAFATAMDRLLGGPAERHRLGHAAREIAGREFTSARMIRDFEALIREHVAC